MAVNLTVQLSLSGSVCGALASVPCIHPTEDLLDQMVVLVVMESAHLFPQGPTNSHSTNKLDVSLLLIRQQQQTKEMISLKSSLVSKWV